MKIKKDKEIVILPMVLEQTSNISQNSNFIISNIKPEGDDDEIDDGINITL
jgi:hypothetical protein